MITISLFYFIFGQASEMADATQQDYYQKELIAFNKGFEAYNKKMMYGADVISVVNKAISNNQSYIKKPYYDASSDQVAYLVDVQFTYNGITYSLSDDVAYNRMKMKWLNYLGTTIEQATGNSEAEEYCRLIGERFRCTNVTYSQKIEGQASNVAGRVIKMEFMQG